MINFITCLLTFVILYLVFYLFKTNYISTNVLFFSIVILMIINIFNLKK